MLPIVIALAVCVLTAALLFSCCAGKKHNQASTNAANKPTKTAIPAKAISEKATQLRTKLAIPEKNNRVCVSVNMEKINEDCYQGMQEHLTSLSEVCTVYVIVQSSTDQDEERQTKQVLAVLQTANIPAHHILHHSSNVGKIAFLRQIQPYLHIEFEDDIYQALKAHIPLLIFHPTASTISTKLTYQYTIGDYHDLIRLQLR